MDKRKRESFDLSAAKFTGGRGDRSIGGAIQKLDSTLILSLLSGTVR